MKNISRAVLFVIMLGLLLALSIEILLNTSRTSFQSQVQSMKEVRGVDRLEVDASGKSLPLSSLSTNQTDKVSYFWCVLRYLFVVLFVFVAPIWAKLLANVTDDWIYPHYKNVLEKRFGRS